MPVLVTVTSRVAVMLSGTLPNSALVGALMSPGLVGISASTQGRGDRVAGIVSDGDGGVELACRSRSETEADRARRPANGYVELGGRKYAERRVAHLNVVHCQGGRAGIADRDGLIDSQANHDLTECQSPGLPR